MQEENKVVTKEDMKFLPKIVAVDFDGTLVSENYPNIGTPDRKMFNLIKILKKIWYQDYTVDLPNWKRAR